MATIREEQVEAFEMVLEYLDKLIPSMETVVGEIKGESKEDTIDFLVQVTDGLNFMLEAYEASSDIINGDKVLINNDVLEASVGVLSEGFSKDDYGMIADELEKSILPFLKVYREATKSFL